MRLHKIPDDVLWIEEIGKSGHAVYLNFVAICKNQGAQFYSENEFLIFGPKSSLNVTWTAVASFTFEAHLFHIP